MATTSFPSLSVFLKTCKFRVVKIADDGNCFYRAVARAYHKDEEFHLFIRQSLMNRFIRDPVPYGELFESKKLRGLAATNKHSHAWNCELATIVPHGVSNLLEVPLEIYSVTNSTGGRVLKSVFGKEFGGCPIRLIYFGGQRFDLLC